MVKRRDFGTPTVEDAEDIEFLLYGETFKCARVVQGSLLLELAEVVGSLDEGEEDPKASAAQASAVLNVFKSVLLPESYKRFRDLTTSADRVVPMENLVEIFEWLLQQYMGGDDTGEAQAEDSFSAGPLTTGPTYAEGL